jgi:hypothetical protein
MTTKEAERYEQMYLALRRIAKGYVSTSQVDRNAERLGLSPHEFLEYAYENIQQEAKNGLCGIRLPKSMTYITPSSGPPIGTKKDGKR